MQITNRKLDTLMGSVLFSSSGSMSMRICNLVLTWEQEGMLGFPASSEAHFRSTICSVSSPYSCLHVDLGSAVNVPIHDRRLLEPEAPSLVGSPFTGWTYVQHGKSYPKPGDELPWTGIHQVWADTPRGWSLIYFVISSLFNSSPFFPEIATHNIQRHFNKEALT